MQSETVVVAFGDAPHAALVAEPSGDVQILWADPGSPLDPVVLRGRDVILYAASGSVEEFAARARDLLAASPGESATLVLGRALGRAEGPQEWSRSFAGFELVAVGESPAGFKVELAEATGSRTPTGGVLRLLVGMLEARSAPTPKAVDRGDEELPRGPAGVDVKQVARPGPQRGAARDRRPPVRRRHARHVAALGFIVVSVVAVAWRVAVHTSDLVLAGASAVLVASMTIAPLLIYRQRGQLRKLRSELARVRGLSEATARHARRQAKTAGRRHRELTRASNQAADALAVLAATTVMKDSRTSRD